MNTEIETHTHLNTNTHIQTQTKSNKLMCILSKKHIGTNALTQTCKPHRNEIKYITDKHKHNHPTNTAKLNETYT